MGFAKMFLVILGCTFAHCSVFCYSGGSSNNGLLQKDSLYFVYAERSYQFVTGFGPSSPEVFEDDGKEFIVFSDYVTAQEIQIFNLNDQSLFCSVPLDEIIASGQMIAGHTVVNRDSILVLCEYTNQLILINRKGEKIKQVDLNKYLNQDTAYALFSRTPILTKDGTIYSGVMLDYYTNLSRGMFKTPEEKIMLEKHTPYLVAINGFFSDSIIVQHGLRNFYARFVRPEGTQMERPKIELLNNRMFMYSNFCDTIYEINPQIMEIENSYPIRSEYSVLGYETATYKESLSGLHNEHAKIEGRVVKLFYDKVNDLFIVTCVHERSDESLESTAARTGSYIIYDNKFNKLNEVKRDDHFFSSIAAYCRSGWLCIKDEKYNKEKAFYVKMTYDLYRLHTKP